MSFIFLSWYENDYFEMRTVNLSAWNFFICFFFVFDVPVFVLS